MKDGEWLDMGKHPTAERLERCAAGERVAGSGRRVNDDNTLPGLRSQWPGNVPGPLNLPFSERRAIGRRASYVGTADHIHRYSGIDSVCQAQHEAHAIRHALYTT
jgi:hypothetical protein